ncbi:conserved hypothetical protein [Natranaerobius thermophilus JW/NM-WN-LF]|uniref:DUF4015 domain-containing protein n=2 Tax=Natranaerobius TaxID=375928 RepID=B2A6N5_NATTJ|nr:conserved hypothetical protein [Natranaerobius thermophilus JW/NM-WN-LF]
MVKKLLIILSLALVMIFSVTACNNSETTDSPKDNEENIDQEEKNENSKDQDQNDDSDEQTEKEDEEEKDLGPEFTYPEDGVRGIYVTGHTAGGSRMEELIELVDDTELNSMVIDVKDDYGNITFKLDGTEFDEFSKNYISDPEEMLEKLSEHDIYPIARVVVFKDTVLAEEQPEYSFRRSDGSVWKNSGGEAFVNPYKEEVWDYNLKIAEKAAEMGFQEIQFDYVRFPEGHGSRADELEYSLGNYTEEELTPRIEEEWEEMLEEQASDNPDFTEYNIDEEDVVEKNEDILEDEEEIKEYKAEELKEKASPPEYEYGLARVMAVSDFTEYAYDRLQSYDVDVSVDVFGYTVTVPESREIGQNFFSILQNVDVISSMIYPSHWGPGYFGISQPDTEPYELVYKYTERENELLDKLEEPPISRPWIQDFTASWLGQGNYISYGVDEVEDQIRALNEQGVEEFLLWNASNRYTKGVDYKPLED